MMFHRPFFLNNLLITLLRNFFFVLFLKRKMYISPHKIGKFHLISNFEIDCPNDSSNPKLFVENENNPIYN